MFQFWKNSSKNETISMSLKPEHLAPGTDPWGLSEVRTVDIIIHYCTWKQKQRDTCEFPGSWFHKLYIDRGRIEKSVCSFVFSIINYLNKHKQNVENYQVFKLYQNQFFSGLTSTGCVCPFFPYSSWTISSLPSFQLYHKTIWIGTRSWKHRTHYTLVWRGWTVSMASKRCGFREQQLSMSL